ncbi:flagellar protein FlaG [Desulfofustis limnaeus]|uniref:Flagellar protein FlaG n=1 Tax=Desulfofustis limnaeus TaxID=2740163 RepID=A0ABM7W8S1_9BACT|nr:flagellar protein FlaG [Desulfofustis limnaeus]BDD87369.1 hypothetical protein DPPLL_17340 [Desulfofustis limnaeus]
MPVEALHITGSSLQQVPRPADTISAARRDQSRDQADGDKSTAASPQAVQPEELLSQIKSLTENGLYSVRFENNPDVDALVVKIVDSTTNELIRQVPAEEILGMKASLAELRGNIVDTVR